MFSRSRRPTRSTARALRPPAPTRWTRRRRPFPRSTQPPPRHRHGRIVVLHSHGYHDDVHPVVWRSGGGGPGRLHEPAGLHPDPRRGRLCVLRETSTDARAATAAPPPGATTYGHDTTPRPLPPSRRPPSRLAMTRRPRGAFTFTGATNTCTCSLVAPRCSAPLPCTSPKVYGPDWSARRRLHVLGHDDRRPREREHGATSSLTPSPPHPAAPGHHLGPGHARQSPPRRGRSPRRGRPTPAPSPFGGRRGLRPHRMRQPPGSTSPVRPEGDYAFSVTTTDALGNVSTAATNTDYVLDATPPPAPTFSSTPPRTGNATSVSWAFTCPGPTATCTLSFASVVSRSSPPAPAPRPTPSPAG